MLITFEEITHLTASKESNSLEFKETTGQLTRGMESGCAFMNSANGGYLLFGSNALCHRDYSNVGGSTGIAIYDDRVEIINTGKLPKGIDINNLTSPHKSIPNNPLIANVLYRRKMLESWGRGLDLIYSECKRVGLPIPTLSDNQGEVVVTFYFKEQVTEQVAEQVTEQVTEQVIALIKVLSDKEMSIKDILEALNLKHRPTLLYDYIQPAMRLDIVEQTQPDSPKSPTQKYRLTSKGKAMI